MSTKKTPKSRKPDDSDAVKTQELWSNALTAVNDLANHFKELSDDAQMYKANRAWHILRDLLL